jgi:hypothetical protein
MAGHALRISRQVDPLVTISKDCLFEVWPEGNRMKSTRDRLAFEVEQVHRIARLWHAGATVLPVEVTSGSGPTHRPREFQKSRPGRFTAKASRIVRRRLQGDVFDPTLLRKLWRLSPLALRKQVFVQIGEALRAGLPKVNIAGLPGDLGLKEVERRAVDGERHNVFWKLILRHCPSLLLFRRTRNASKLGRLARTAQ